jgi:hypothetical protein
MSDSLHARTRETEDDEQIRGIARKLPDQMNRQQNKLAMNPQQLRRQSIVQSVSRQN